MVVLLILAILLAIAIPTFLGVTGGANDRAAQSNLNTALTTVKAAAANNNQTYSGIATTQFAANEPSLTWNYQAAVTTQGPISWTVSGDGNGIVLASYSKNGATCWYASDNQATVGSTGWAAPTAPGVQYNHATIGTATGDVATCNSNANVPTTGWTGSL
jgi:type IV pilus assembly protein PilA